MKPLKPIVSKEQQRERLRRVAELEKVYPRIGGGVFQVTVEEDDDGWTVVYCTFVRRDLKNNKGELLPDGGLLDIEATKGAREVVCDNREITIYGKSSDPDPIVEKVVNDSGIGVVTRKRGGRENDASGEVIMAIYTPGNWESAKDSQFDREIVKVKIDPNGKIFYNYFGASGCDRLPADICTEKVLLAIRIASDICKVLNE